MYDIRMRVRRIKLSIRYPLNGTMCSDQTGLTAKQVVDDIPDPDTCSVYCMDQSVVLIDDHYRYEVSNPDVPAKVLYGYLVKACLN